jgi:hypothetical protein
MSKEDKYPAHIDDAFARKLWDEMEKLESEHRQELQSAIKKGDLNRLSELMHDFGRPLDDYAGDHGFLIGEMIKKPEDCPYKNYVMDALLKTHFNVEQVVNELVLGGHNEDEIWSMYHRDPTPDTLATSASIIAEFLHYRVRRGIEIKMPLELIAEARTLRDAFVGERMKSSLLVTQHALVDHVTASNANDVTRGGGFLKFSDFLDGAELWTKKISSFRETRTDSIRNGPGIKYTPVFG